MVFVQKAVSNILYLCEWSKTFGQIRGELCCTTLLCSLVQYWFWLQFWLIRTCIEGLHLFKLREQSSWLSSLCICILCGDLGIVLCRSSWNRSMLLLSQNQITKWRISDFINLGLNFKGLFWTIFTHFADRMEQPCRLSVKELGCRTFLLSFLVVRTSYLHMCEEWFSVKSQIFFLLYQYYLWFSIYIALCRFVDEFDIDTPDNNIHKHIPFAILLIKIADDWRKAHDGKLPANVREFKVRFKLPQRSYFLDIWQQQTR